MSFMIPNDAGATVNYAAKMLVDGGADCSIAFSQLAATAGEFYEGTFTGNLRRATGDDGGTYVVTNGSFRAKR